MPGFGAEILSRVQEKCFYNLEVDSITRDPRLVFTSHYPTPIASPMPETHIARRPQSSACVAMMCPFLWFTRRCMCQICCAITRYAYARTHTHTYTCSQTSTHVHVYVHSHTRAHTLAIGHQADHGGVAMSFSPLVHCICVNWCQPSFDNRQNIWSRCIA
jgi:hypothetical protein